MKKLALILTFFLAISLLLSSAAFAENNMLQDAGNSITGAAQGATNVVQGALSGVGNMIGNGAQSIMNTADNMTTDDTTGTEQNNGMNEDVNAGMTERNADEDYTATRTSTDATGEFLGLSATAWTWLIIAIAGALIVGMVYFYGKQYDGMATDHREE